MTLAATILGVIPFTIIFLVVFIPAFKFLFSHQLIANYSAKLNVPKTKINEYISENINKKYEITLIEIDEEEQNAAELDDDENKVQKTEAKSSIYNHSDLNSSLGSLDDAPTFKISNAIIRIVFSLVFALSIELIFLMMCELTNSLNKESRLISFKITIDSLIIFITIVQPFLIISLYLNQEIFPIKASLVKKLVTAAFYILWFMALHKFGHISQNFSPQLKDLHTRSLLERKINEIVISGITTMAVLSGIGSTSTPYKQFIESGIFKKLVGSGNKYLTTPTKKEVNETDLNKLIQSYNHTNLLLNKRKFELNKLLVSNSGTVYNNPNKSSEDMLLHSTKTTGPGDDLVRPGASPNQSKVGGMIHKVQSFASLTSYKMKKEKTEEEELNSEIQSLYLLRNHIYDDLIKSIFKFDNQKQNLINDNKLLSKLTNWSMSLFSLYCIYRIVNVIFIRLPYLYWFHTNDLKYMHDKTNVIDTQEIIPDEDIINGNTRDALAVTLAKLIQTIVSIPISEAQLVTQISFVLAGSLFLCSFSNVLVTLKSVGKIFPSLMRISIITKNWLKHLVISELLAIYVISTALLIRTNLPTHLSNQISRILSLTGSSASSSTRSSLKEVEFIDIWFDKVFGITSIITITIIIIKRIIDNDDPFKDDYDDYDEEMMIEDSSQLYKTA